MPQRERVLWENERREIGIGRISRVRPFSNVPLSLLRFRAGSKTGPVIQAPRAERTCTRKHAGISLSANGIARAYAEVVDGVVADERVDDLPALVTETLMQSADDRLRLAREVLEFASALRA